MPEQFAADAELTITFGQLDELLEEVRDDGEAYPDEMFAAGVNYGAQHLHRAIVERAAVDEPADEGRTAPEALSDATGRPAEEFSAPDSEHPHPSELESVADDELDT